MKTWLTVIALLVGCGPGESQFPSSTGSINTDWNEDADAPDLSEDSGDDDDDDDGGNSGGGNSGGGNSGGGTGGDLYVQNCVSCHGQDGEGSGSAPALAGEIDTLTDGELLDIIMDGTGSMPASGLSEDEAQTLLEWLRNAWA